jgi:hypothetical protein
MSWLSVLVEAEAAQVMVAVVVLVVLLSRFKVSSCQAELLPSRLVLEEG